MNKEMILGIIRHALTTGGGALVANGTLGQDDVTSIVGGLIALVGVVWSIFNKKK